MACGGDVPEQRGRLAVHIHGERRLQGYAAPRVAPHARVGRIDRVVHQLGVAGAEGGLREAEARGQAPEDLGIGQRLTLPRDHRLGALQPVGAVGGVEIRILEMARGGQHDVGIGEAIRHHHVASHREEILAREASLEPVLIGVDDHGIVVVDEQRLDGRRQRGVEEIPADVDDIDGPRARRHEVGTHEPRGRLGERMAGAVHQPAPVTPHLPASAGSANTARMPLPPFWLRSSPLPTLMAAGESV